MNLVISHKNQVATTSVLVAQKFDKEHKNVLRDIEQLTCSQSFRRLNFELSSYKNRQNKDMPMYIMTKDGFTLLVMSFTGAKAALFREEYINAFNRMEAILRMAPPPSLLPTYTERVLANPTKDCPRTHFTVFDASHPIMLFIEKHIGSVSKYDLVDGSIGLRWARYREGKEWAEDCSTYIHDYKDERGRRTCKCYKYSEFTHFRNWLLDVYQTTYLYEYLHSKYAKEKNQAMLDKVENLLPKLLKAG